MLDDYAFPGRVDHAAQVGTRQYARLLDGRVTGNGLRAVQILPTHTTIESAMPYLGVDVEGPWISAEGGGI